MVWESFLIAAAALKTPTRNGYNAQGVNLTTPPTYTGEGGVPEGGSKNTGGVAARSRVVTLNRLSTTNLEAASWPLRDIAITNIV